MTITHSMAHRLAIGMELRKHAEPQTIRALGAATGINLTDVDKALREMEMLGMVKRIERTGYVERQAKANAYGWLYIEQEAA